MMCACIDPTNVGSGRWEPPLVDEEWHAMCQAIYMVFLKERCCPTVHSQH